MAVVHLDSDTEADEKLAECLRFIRWFKQRFVQDGQTAPPFFEGLLSDATCAAWNAPALKVKMLAMYLHHEGSSWAADFASHLQFDAVRQVITNLCVLWGWDTTSPHNWHLIVDMVLENFGNFIGTLFQEMLELDFPCMILLTRGKEGIDLVELVPGSPHKSNTVMALYRAANLFETKLRPSLALKENSKKQKSLFCGGSWTKVTEAMAINANMATYRFMLNRSSGVANTNVDAGKDAEGENEDLQVIDLEKILTIRQVNSDGRASGSTRSSDHDTNATLPEDKLSRKGRLKIVEQLMLEDLSLNRMCSPD